MIKIGDKVRIKGLELTINNVFDNTVVVTYMAQDVRKFAMVSTAGLLKVLSTYKILNVAA
jgi:hypothetical protein